MAFAVGVLEVARKMPRDATGRHVAGQLVRCGTSAGANYEEARAAESRADFVHKTSIAAKEAREARYWLGLSRRAKLIAANQHELHSHLVREAQELAAILGASARTARSRAD